MANKYGINRILTDADLKSINAELEEKTSSIVLNINDKLYVKSQIKGYLTFTSNNTFTLTVPSSTRYNGLLEYSTDTEVWTAVTKDVVISSVDNKIYLRGSGNTHCRGNYDAAYIQNRRPAFSLTGTNIKCEGNIETLLDYQTVLNNQHPVMGNYCFQCMFYGCTNLITAPTLPATTLTNYCYHYMFYGCTSLTIAPELPATTLTTGCYQFMFSDCTGLTTAPALPATILADGGYYAMFSGCTNLTTLPALSATKLDYGNYYEHNPCYRFMFFQCSSIKLSTTQSDEYPYEYRIPYGTAITTETSSYLVERMFDETGGTFTGTPEFNTTYYTSNKIIENNNIIDSESAPGFIISELVTKADLDEMPLGTQIEVNPELTGDETKLSSISIDGVNYDIPEGAKAYVEDEEMLVIDDGDIQTIETSYVDHEIAELREYVDQEVIALQEYVNGKITVTVNDDDTIDVIIN